LIELVRDLWLIDAESEWTVEDVDSTDEGRARLRRYVEQVLKLIHTQLPMISHSYAAVTGLESGFFKPIGSFHRPLSSIRATPTDGKGTLVGLELDADSDILVINDPPACQEYCGDPNVRQKVILKLRSHGEFFGFVSLDSYQQGAVGEERMADLQKALPVLSRTLSDAVFTMRLRLLGAPFLAGSGQSGLSDLYTEIAARTAHGFGADLAVLRIYNPDRRLLIAEGIHGNAISDLLSDRRPGEGISGQVFASSEKSWAMSASQSDPLSGSGLAVTADDEHLLRRCGLRSYLIMRLRSQLHNSTQSDLGTLSFSHTQFRRYSWRDVALFKSFCQRAADTIALYTTNLHLEETAESLRLQSLRMTQVEIVALLAHDLGHKVFEASTSVDKYIKRANRAIERDHRTSELLKPDADKALNSLLATSHTLSQIRSMYQFGLDAAGEPREFQILDVVEEMERTLSGALGRNKIEVKSTFIGSMKMKGYRTVLIQALYNLMINSIEAIRTSKRGSTIFIHAQDDRQTDSQRIIITFWDDGPGINQRLFPNPQDIFLVGRTSKPSGTGTGLPVSRSLLTHYFRADLRLEDPKKALFRVTLPAG
jgi:signal transduction histidine kinase